MKRLVALFLSLVLAIGAAGPVLPEAIAQSVLEVPRGIGSGLGGASAAGNARTSGASSLRLDASRSGRLLLPTPRIGALPSTGESHTQGNLTRDSSGNLAALERISPEGQAVKSARMSPGGSEATYQTSWTHATAARTPPERSNATPRLLAARIPNPEHQPRIGWMLHALRNHVLGSVAPPSHGAVGRENPGGRDSSTSFGLLAQTVSALEASRRISGGWGGPESQRTLDHLFFLDTQSQDTQESMRALSGENMRIVRPASAGWSQRHEDPPARLRRATPRDWALRPGTPQPARSATAESKLIQDEATVRVENLDAALQQLRETSIQNPSIQTIAEELSKDRPDLPIHPRATFLLPREPELLKLLQISPQALATAADTRVTAGLAYGAHQVPYGTARLLTDGAQNLLLLIVVVPAEGNISRLDLAHTLVQAAERAAQTGLPNARDLDAADPLQPPGLVSNFPPTSATDRSATAAPGAGSSDAIISDPPPGRWHPLKVGLGLMAAAGLLWTLLSTQEGAWRMIFAAGGTLAYQRTLLQSDWRDPRSFLYDVPTLPVIGSFTGATLFNLLAGNLGYALPSLAALLGAAIVALGVHLRAWPVAGYLAVATVVGILEAASLANPTWLRLAALVPIVILLLIRTWFPVDTLMANRFNTLSALGIGGLLAMTALALTPLLTFVL